MEMIWKFKLVISLTKNGIHCQMAMQLGALIRQTFGIPQIIPLCILDVLGNMKDTHIAAQFAKVGERCHVDFMTTDPAQVKQEQTQRHVELVTELGCCGDEACAECYENWRI